MDMYIEKLEDLSIHYWLIGLFQDFPQLKIVDEFPDDDLTIPTVSHDIGRMDIEDFELGKRDGIRIRKWYIDIFAKTKTQREDIGYRIINALKEGITVYNYNEGFPPDTNPSEIGHLNVRARQYDPMQISPDLNDKLYYRAVIAFVAVNDKL